MKLVCVQIDNKYFLWLASSPVEIYSTSPSSFLHFFFCYCCCFFFFFFVVARSPTHLAEFFHYLSSLEHWEMPLPLSLLTASTTCCCWNLVECSLRLTRASLTNLFDCNSTIRIGCRFFGEPTNKMNKPLWTLLCLLNLFCNYFFTFVSLVSSSFFPQLQGTVTKMITTCDGLHTVSSPTKLSLFLLDPLFLYLLLLLQMAKREGCKLLAASWMKQAESWQKGWSETFKMLSNFLTCFFVVVVVAVVVVVVVVLIFCFVAFSIWSTCSTKLVRLSKLHVKLVEGEAEEVAEVVEVVVVVQLESRSF